MFVLLAVRPVGQGYGRAFQMDRATTPAYAGIERRVDKVELKTQPVAVIGDGGCQIINKKLGRMRSQFCAGFEGLILHAVLLISFAEQRDDVIEYLFCISD
jgi:hypothetical protein